MDLRVAKRYARALFSAASKNGIVDAVEADLNAITGLLENHESFGDFVHTPRINREDKIQVLDRVFSDRATALTMQALRLMMHKRRESELGALRNEFARLRREQGEVLYAQVSSVIELTDAQKKALVDKLATKSGKRVEAEYRVDPTLVGGIKVALGNYVLDGSIKGSLSRLKEALRRDLLKQN